MATGCGTTRYAAVSCDDSEKWGYSEATIQRLKDIHCREGEEWTAFHALRGQVPTIEDLQKFKGVIISGSINSANDNVDWILKLQEFIRGAANHDENSNKRSSKLKIIGVCFGHQLIAKALGGKVGLNPDKDFVLQTEEITATKEGENAESIKGLFEAGPVRITQCHGDCITELPKGAVSLGTSATCEYEIVQYTDNILGIQSHPEMFPEEAKSLVLPAISKRYNWSPEKVQEVEQSFKMDLKADTMNKVMKKFLTALNMPRVLG
ncbi:hypothetical protein QZH41_007861 [Actinostola sp. cb2023]|nr:hypothetical protein QZH41_007861 [Actinostola sp. cb2023]